MNKVYILGACRTPIGKMGGTLAGLSAVDLGATVIREAVSKAKIEPSMVDHVILGCVIQACTGPNVARQAAVKAGLPYSTTAETVNMLCASGLDSIIHASNMIRLGDADIIVAGGTESMSNAPFAILKGRYGYRIGYPQCESQLYDTLMKDALWDAFVDAPMGLTAENIVNRWKLSRSELDEFALNSHEKACHAMSTGAFDKEIIPVQTEKKGNYITASKDECPRQDTSLELLSKLRPSFSADGKVTAGNSSGINDGAAAVVLISEKKLKELGLLPQAEWIDYALAGIEPEIMGVAPINSTNKLLEKLHISMSDIDLIEANEAFAAQSLVVMRELGIPNSKLNVNGGAIALGHPLGASGCRILVTLIYAMQKRNADIGLASMCIGGGMGCSAVIKVLGGEK